MMASIPNMRSTPLPVPNAKTAQAGDPASAGFSIELPPVPATGQGPATTCQTAPATLPIEGITLLPDGSADPAGALPPVTGEVTADGDTDQPAEKKAETGKDGETPSAVVIPFLPDMQPIARAQPLPTPIVEGEAPATPIADRIAAMPVNATTGRPNADAEDGKQDAPAPADGEDAAATVDAPELAAAVKQLIQRKQVLAKQVAQLPKTAGGDKANPDTGPIRTDATTAGAAQTAPYQTPMTPVAIQVAAPSPVGEVAQPMLAPETTAAIKGQGTTPVDAAARSADLPGTERKLDLARDSAWLDRLAHDIARSASDETPLRFRLHPQTLGHLQVELQQGDRGTAVRMTVDTEAARQILSDAQPRLAAEARAQGVRIAETHVDLSGSGRQAPGDQRRQDEARQTPFIRTAPGAVAESAEAARTARRARLDRYA